jgi:hypothetical protein
MGCDGGGGGGGTDSGMTTGTDAGPPSAPAVLKEDGSPANFSCIGSATAPAGTGDATITLHAADFLSDADVGGVTVHFFPDNMPNSEDTCEGTCIEVMTDDVGDAMVTGNAGGWYAYRILAMPSMPEPMSSDPVRTVQYNEVTPNEGGSATLNSVSQQAIGLIPSFLGRTRLPGTAVFSGTIEDCDGDAVQNARFRLYQGSTEIMHGTADTDPIFGHFTDTSSPLPNPLEILPRSTPNGLYAAANVPTGSVRVEIWGATEEGGTEQILGCEEVQAFGDTVTIINVGGLRMDGPAGCPTP